MSMLIAALALAASPIAASPLAELSWLEGNWEGPGIAGAPATEVYSAPAGGQIVGHFRQMKADGTPMFYELLLIDEKDGQLRYLLKHFNPDMTGWEEKNVVREFPFTRRVGDRWEFSGLTLERTGPDSMTASVIAGEVDGKPQILLFHYVRTR
jgi:hypothetical protein